VDTTGASIDVPYGITLDPISGFLYYTNIDGGQISRVNLDGTGGGVDLASVGASQPAGIALNTATGTLYWTEYGDGSIDFAPAAGGAAQALNLQGTHTQLQNPTGIVINPTLGTLYWTNGNGTGPSALEQTTISTGMTSDIATGSAPLDAPHDLAVDVSGNTILWDNWHGADPLGKASMINPGTSGVIPTTVQADFPQGVAFDPTTQLLYWAPTSNELILQTSLEGNSSTFSDAPNGGGWTADMAILAPPNATTSPILTSDSAAQPVLTCANGVWDQNQPGDHYFDAPASYVYSWSLNGTPIAGESSNELTARTTGSYSCSVVASNAAGQTTVSSSILLVGNPSPPISVKTLAVTGTNLTLPLGLATALLGLGGLGVLGAQRRRRRV
jgi:hypothetical protein